MSGMRMSEMIRSGACSRSRVNACSPVLRETHGVAFALEQMSEELSHSEFVVNDQKVGHRAFSFESINREWRLFRRLSLPLVTRG
jgi:hypothetical protein